MGDSKSISFYILGQGDFRMSKKISGHPILMNLYHQLNVQYFEGELPLLPCLYNRRLRTTMGRTLFERKGLRRRWSPVMIDVSSRLETAHLRKTMVHEMCHVWCSIHHQDISHSDIFWQKMSACGYPLGHLQEGVEDQDMWQTTEGTQFLCGQSVYFIHKGTRINGTVIRINRRTISVQETGKSEHWRVSPSTLKIQL